MPLRRKHAAVATVGAVIFLPVGNAFMIHKPESILRRNDFAISNTVPGLALYASAKDFSPTSEMALMDRSPAAVDSKEDSTVTSALDGDSDHSFKKIKKASGAAPNLVIEGDTLETLPSHVTLVLALWCLSAAALSPVIATAASLSFVTKAKCLSVVFGSIVFSDFFSGVFHWSTDNYGNRRTPVFGSVIEAFQGHHATPWTITYRSFFNNVHKIAKSAIPMLVVCMALSGGIATGIAPLERLIGVDRSSALTAGDCIVRLFWVIFFNAQMLSQEFHKLSHTVKPPQWAAWLQKRGLILSRKEHGLHHSSPFEAHYCIFTGQCNTVLDKSHFWRRLEAIIYRANGVEPNCWKEDPHYPEIKEFALSL